MIVRTCDVLSCEAATSDANPGREWLRLDVVTHLMDTTGERRWLDACSPAHGVELLDEVGEQTLDVERTR